MNARFLHSAYSRLYAARQWRRHHLNPAGVILLTALVLSAVLGVHITQTSIYRLAAFCCSTVFITFLTSRLPFKPQLTIHRVLPDFVTIGTDITYQIEITNHSTKPETGLFLYEIIADPRPSLEALLEHPEPFEHRRNWWDRKTLYYRWTWLLRKRGKARFQQLSLPPIAAGETIRVKATCTIQQRGYLHFSGVAVLRPDILGLFNRRSIHPLADKLLILPRQIMVAPPELSNARHFQPGGISLASSIGNSDEFMSLRPYRPGDPLRNIHWRSYAKTGELIIKEYEDEFYVRYALILDTFIKKSNEFVFEEAVGVGASLLTSMQMNDAILDLLFVGDKTYSFSSGRGLAPMEKMLEILACVEANRDQSVRTLAPVLKDNIARFSGIICLFLGWSDAHREIRTLLHRAGVPSWILVLTDNEEATREFIAGDPGGLQNITIREVVLSDSGVSA